MVIKESNLLNTEQKKQNVWIFAMKRIYENYNFGEDRRKEHERKTKNSVQ